MNVICASRDFPSRVIIFIIANELIVHGENIAGKAADVVAILKSYGIAIYYGDITLRTFDFSFFYMEITVTSRRDLLFPRYHSRATISVESPASRGNIVRKET